MPFCGDFSVTEEQNIISKICCYDKKNSKIAQFGNLMAFLEKYLRLFDLCCYFYYIHHILFLFSPLKIKKTLTTNIEGYMYMYLCVNEVCMCINFSDSIN